MPDISMCKGKDCPIKNKCLRYRAIPCEFMQSYFSEPPYKDGKCEHFMEIDGWKRITEIKENETAV